MYQQIQLRADLQNQVGILEGNWSGPDHIRARGFPGRKRWQKDRSLKIELTRANIEYGIKSFPEVDWSGVEHIVQEHNRIIEQRKMGRQSTPLEAYAFPFKTKPYKHQKEAWGVGKDAEYFAYFMEMGTGKSKVLIDVGAWKYSVGEIEAIILTSPNGVNRQWVEEQLPTHMPDFVEYKAMAYQSNHTAKWKRDWEDLCNFEGLKVFSFHIDAFSTPKGVKMAEYLLSKYKVMWAIDESTRIKSPSAKRTKNILRLSSAAVCRAIMSGAPITQGLEDLYSQLQFLSEDILGYGSFWAFKNHFTVQQQVSGAPMGVTKIVGYNNVDEFTSLVSPHSFRVRKDECLDLPEKIYLTRRTEMSKEQIEKYNQLKDELFVSLKSENGELVTVDVPNVLTQLMKLQQIVCGFVIDEEGGVNEIKNSRIETLMETIEQMDGKIIVWARFIHDIRTISERLKKEGIGFVEYTGQVKQEQRKLNIDCFNNDPNCKIFLGNPVAGGTGLNLQVANNMIYYSNDFNADTRWQSEDRIHRSGQTRQCTYVDIIAPGTIDEQIVGALRNKKNVADSVMGAIAVIEGLNSL